MINWIVIAISALMLVFFLVWWRCSVLRVWTEKPKYFMLRQERRFDEEQKRTF